jgi:ribonuclease D
VDLEPLARKRGFRQSSLAALCCLLLGFRISKAQRCSNWECSVLSPAQIAYASTDAWASREIALVLLDQTTAYHSSSDVMLDVN